MERLKMVVPDCCFFVLCMGNFICQELAAYV